MPKLNMPDQQVRINKKKDAGTDQFIMNYYVHKVSKTLFYFIIFFFLHAKKKSVINVLQAIK